MEINFHEFCMGLRGLTEEEACKEVLKKRHKLTNERNFSILSDTEKRLNEDWDEQLRRLYQRINPDSKEMFKLEEVIQNA